MITLSDSLINKVKKICSLNNDAIYSMNLWGKDEENKSMVLDMLIF